jgi:hypothetical protein
MAMNACVLSQGSVKSGAELHRHLADRQPCRRRATMGQARRWAAAAADTAR